MRQRNRRAGGTPGANSPFAIKNQSVFSTQPFSLLCLFQPLIIFPDKFPSVGSFGGFHLRESFYRQIFAVDDDKRLGFQSGI